MKSATLFCKWWWCFATEGDPLWKRIMILCNNFEPVKLIMECKHQINGGLWSAICNIENMSREVEEVVRHGLWMLVGNG